MAYQEYPDPNAAAESGGSGLGVAIIEDQQVAGTLGGTATQNVWEQRVLNAKPFDTLVGTEVTVSANQFTLDPDDADSEYIIDWRCSHYNTEITRSQLYDVTNTAEVQDSGAVRANGSNGHGIYTFGSASVTISDATTYRIQQYCQTTKASTGLGNVSAQDSTTEVFTSATVTRIK